MLHLKTIIMPPLLTTGGERHYVFESSDRTFIVCLLTLILRDAMFLTLLEGFHCNLSPIFNMWVSVAEKVFKVKGRRSRLILRGQNARLQQRHMFKWCGIAAHLFNMQAYM